MKPFTKTPTAKTMNAAKFLKLPAILLAAGVLHAQPAPNNIEAVNPTDQTAAETPTTDESANASPAEEPGEANVQVENPSSQPPRPPQNLITPATPTGEDTFAPQEEENQEFKKSGDGYLLDKSPLNDTFLFLAKQASRQYFFNPKIDGPEFLVTGNLIDGDPLQNMEALALQNGLTLHTKGNTIYALTQAQLAQLPSTEFHYQLRYLRPNDMEQIKELIKPMLNPGTGIVNFEPKTNTIIIIDSPHRIEQARQLLHGIDKAKGQIIVETKILRINSNAAERTGVNWSSVLGRDGTSLTLSRDLSSMFGLQLPVVTSDEGASPENDEGTSPGTNLVLDKITLTGVLRALAEGNLASQMSNPTLITEDNEQAAISIIDRIPIITTTTTAAGGSSDNPTVTEEVRYKIDTSDLPIDSSPDKHREIGISLVVTPTLLPDGTIRMKMRPRSAQIIEQIESPSGNKYPRVTESMVECLARVPDGHSLVVGGFYGESQITNKTKIPLVGDLPVVNFFFKSKEATKEKTSLVFIITPKSYDPTRRGDNGRVSSNLRASTSLDCDHDWIDPHNPGQAHEPNLKRSIRGLKPTQVPYFPTGKELNSAPSSPQRTQPRFSRGGKR